MGDENKKISVPLPREITDYEQLLNLSKYWIFKTEADKKISDFRARFRNDPKLELLNTEETIKMDDLRKKLFKPASKQGRTEAGNKNFITGIRISIGMNDRKELQLIYRAEFLERRTTGRRTFKGTAKPVGYGQFYILKNNVLDQISYEAAEQAKELFKSEILIKRFEKGAWEKYDRGNRFKHDTRSIFFSFQEIYMLYHKEYEKKAQQGNYDCPMTFVCAARNKGNWRYAKRYKQVLIIRGNNKDESMFLGPGDDQDGNLGHVCPPSRDCDKIEYSTI